MTLTRATLAEAELLLSMMERFNAEDAIPWTRDGGRLPLHELLTEPELGIVCIGREGGVVVGYFVLTYGYDLEFGGRDAFITELYVEPSHRGRGLGRWLLEACENLAREHDVRALHLMVRPENLRAVGLYESAGFRSPARRFLTKTLG